MNCEEWIGHDYKLGEGAPTQRPKPNTSIQKPILQYKNKSSMKSQEIHPLYGPISKKEINHFLDNIKIMADMEKRKETRRKKKKTTTSTPISGRLLTLYRNGTQQLQNKTAREELEAHKDFIHAEKRKKLTFHHASKRQLEMYTQGVETLRERRRVTFDPEPFESRDDNPDVDKVEILDEQNLNDIEKLLSSSEVETHLFELHGKLPALYGHLIADVDALHISEKKSHDNQVSSTDLPQNENFYIQESEPCEDRVPDVCVSKATSPCESRNGTIQEVETNNQLVPHTPDAQCPEIFFWKNSSHREDTSPAYSEETELTKASTMTSTIASEENEIKVIVSKSRLIAARGKTQFIVAVDKSKLLLPTLNYFCQGV